MPLSVPDNSAADPLAETENWTAAAKERAYAELRAAAEVRRQVFYCTDEAGKPNRPRWRDGKVVPDTGCDGAPHGAYPYRHARADQWPPTGADWFLWFLMGGRGCVAPWTRIYDPVTGEHVAVEDLASRGVPAAVSTLRGPAVSSGAPFLKGEAHQWTVVLADGNEITVTDQHRFLTPDGWRPLAALHVRQPIASGGPAPAVPASVARSAWLAGAHRSSGTPADSPAGCPTCHRSHGRRLPCAAAGGPASALPRVGAAGRSRRRSRPGAPAGAPAGSRTDRRSPLRSRTHCAPAVLAPAAAGCLAVPSPAAPAPRSGPRWQRRSPRTSSPIRSVVAVAPARTAGSLEATPLRSDDPSELLPLVSTWTEIVSITYSHYGVFYDLAVPDGNHYRAEGVVNHNSGKTRTGAEYVRQLSKSYGRIALVGATNSAIRDTMVEGVSGLIPVFAAYGERIDYKPALKKITFPSGAVAGLFTGEEPDRLRGPQHGAFWIDEPSHFPLIDDVWDQLMFGLRLGTRPHGVCTSTPLPNKWTKARIAEANTRLSRVSTYANMANLAPQFRETVLARYEGTRLGRQELEGEILEDVEGALWRAALIVRSEVDAATMDRIIVSIDPAGTANRRSDETGLTVVGKRGRLGYVLEDHSGKFSPQGWAEKAIWAYRAHKADAIVAEKNFGGDMVKSTIETAAKDMGQTVRVIVTTASRSKALRAEPIVSLYEQSRIFHNGLLAELEEEMLTWVPGTGASPNRIDAMVHGFTELFGTSRDTNVINPLGAARMPARPRSFATAIKRAGIRRPT